MRSLAFDPSTKARREVNREKTPSFLFFFFFPNGVIDSLRGKMLKDAIEKGIIPIRIREIHLG